MNKHPIGLSALVILLFAGLAPLGAQDNALRMFSPRLNSLGISTASTESPYGDAVNPAASAGTQRTTLDISYFLLPGFLATEQGTGHWLNLGASFPSNLGVFTVSGHLATSNLPSLPWGTFGAFNFSFAKDVLDDLYFGLGVGFQIGDRDWGLGLDIGFINVVGDPGIGGTIGFMKDFQWGVAIRGLGKGMNTLNATTINTIPPNFTPSIGTQFKLIKTPDISLGFVADLSFPTVQNLDFTVGLDLSIMQIISLQASYELDLVKTLAGTSRSIPLSFGFGLNLGGKMADTGKTDNAAATARTNEFNPSLSVSPVRNGIWAFGLGLNVPIGVIDTTPPQIELGDPVYEDNTEAKPADAKTKPAAPAKTSSLPGEGFVVSGFFHLAEAQVGSGATEKTDTAAGDSGVKAGTGATAYISPNLDGTKDTLVVPFSIKDERFITSFSLVIKNAAGAVVRTIKNKETRPETTVSNIFQRFFRVKQGLNLPKTLVWDGRADDGSVVPDGTYHYLLESTDDNNNVGRTAERVVVVDTKAPDLKSDAPQKAFAPGGDRPAIIINQSSNITLSPIDTWTASIVDANGNEVRSWSLKAPLPAQTIWDGKTNAGILAPDGLYSFRLTANNRAGNKAASEINNIQLINQQTPIGLSIDNAWFSPNGDGIKDIVRVSINGSDKVKVDNWSAQLFNSKGQVSRSFKGTDTMPRFIVVDGLGDSGKLLPEDSYSLKLSVLYINGNKPDAVSPAMTLDITKPQIAVSADYRIFSPNGDSDKNSLPIHQKGSPETVWEGAIRAGDGTGTVNRSWSWRGQPDELLVWDGRDKDSKPVLDGEYTYQITATDLAGNTGTSAPLSITVDNRPTDVSIRANRSAFSPGTASVLKTVGLELSQSVPEGIATWTVQVLTAPAATGSPVFTISGKGAPPANLAWDGKKTGGGIAEDGLYVARYSLVYDKGNKPSAVSNPFQIDTKPPQISLEPEYLVFSPDGDSLKDTIKIKQVSSKEDQWEGQIQNTAGTILRTYYWKGTATNFSWDGRDENGNRQPDGTYKYAISATTKAGNGIKKELSGIVIDTRATPVLLLTDTKGFAPGSNRPALATISFRPLLTLAEGVSNWTLKMTLQGKTPLVERVLSGTGLPPTSIIWDGTANDGKTLAAEGRYEAVLTVEYLKGNKPETRSPGFVLDVSGPAIQLAVAPKPFSPDDDGVDDEVTIGIGVDDLSPISDWSMEILDPQGTHFLTFNGMGTPTSRVVWNGRSDTGELVQAAIDYPCVLTVTDSLGNRSVSKTSIPVDVLVMRDGDLLRIRIPGISFPPDSADLSSDKLDQEKLAQNVRTLNRLAEILRKYGSYQITVEGHANITQYNDPKAAERENINELMPLSEKRAAAVRAALINRGIATSRLSTVGKGGSLPVVPNNDLTNVWKNRRVEFILKK